MDFLIWLKVYGDAAAPKQFCEQTGNHQESSGLVNILCHVSVTLWPFAKLVLSSCALFFYPATCTDRDINPERSKGIKNRGVLVDRKSVV